MLLLNHVSNAWFLLPRSSFPTSAGDEFVRVVVHGPRLGSPIPFWQRSIISPILVRRCRLQCVLGSK